MNRLDHCVRFGLLALLAGLFAPAGWAQSMANSEDNWQTFIRHGNTDAALRVFEEIVEDEPSDALAQAGLAYLSEHRMDAPDSLAAFLDALRHGADDPEAVLYLMEAMERVETRADAQRAADAFSELLDAGIEADHVEARVRYAYGQVLRRLGRWQAAEAQFAQLGFVESFWFCGPFDNAEKRGHDAAYGPESNLDLEAEYPGRRRQVGWQPLNVNPVAGQIDMHALLAPSHESSAYLLAVIEADEDKRVQLGLGHAGAVKAWLNGDLVADMNRYHPAMPDQVTAEAALQAGRNVLLLKVSGGETGDFQVSVRIPALAGDGVRVLPAQDYAGESFSAPAPDQEPPQDESVYEPVSIRQLKALGEAENAPAYRHFFYARLIQRLHVADENDRSANSMLNQLNQAYGDNPFLLVQQSYTEDQANRARLLNDYALKLDEEDAAAFTNLINYHTDSPYATQGLDLIDQWKAKRGKLPAGAHAMEARLLRKQSLPEAAAQRLMPLDEDASAHQRLHWVRWMGNRLTAEEQAKQFEAMLEQDATFLPAVHSLRRLGQQQGDEAAVERWLAYERRVDPFSLSGLVDVARYQQASGDHEQALQTLDALNEIAPQNFEAQRLRAISHQSLGDALAALSALEAALAIQPSHPWCLEYREFLQPDDETYASPYLRDGLATEIPTGLDLSQANYVVLLKQQITRVYPNGNSRQTVREVVRVLTDNGVRRQQARGIYFEGGSEDVIVKRARVWKPNGESVDAPPVEKRSAMSAADAAAKLYGDYRVAILRFPALEKGALIEVEYEKVSKSENIYADYFGEQFFIGDSSYEPTIDTEYVLITPKSRTFYWKYTPPNYPPEVVDSATPELDPEPEVIEDETTRTRRWRFGSLPKLPREPRMPFYSEILPYIKVSTFETWQELTTWYWQLVEDQLDPGPVVRQRTQQVLAQYKESRGIPQEENLTAWQKVRAINEYVNTGIRYLGLEFGIHGYKPHDVEEICNAQYGDCKDKAALAIAMLGEVGIEARMAILRTTQRGEIDYELPMLGIFNHAIYYLPDFEGQDYWIDGTATFFGATELPPGDAGANSLIVEPGGDSFFKRIRHSQPQDNGAVYTTVLDLDEEGHASGYRTASYNGLFNPLVRSTYENPNKAKEQIDRALAREFPGAESSQIELSDLNDYAKDERISYNLEIPEFAVQQSDAWQTPSALFQEELSQRYAQLSRRQYDLVLNYPWTRTNITRIALPQGWSPSQLPEDRELESEFGHYSRHARFEDNELVIREEIVFTPIRVPREQYDGFREFCRLADLYQDETVTLIEQE